MAISLTLFCGSPNAHNGVVVEERRQELRSPRQLEAADRTATFHPSLPAAGYHIHGCYGVRLRTALKNFVD
jgi:hypothetical protein